MNITSDADVKIMLMQFGIIKQAEQHTSKSTPASHTNGRGKKARTISFMAIRRIPR